MNIRNYSILIRAFDLQASSPRIDSPDRSRHWPFSGDCSHHHNNNNSIDVQVVHKHLKTTDREIICPAGRDVVEHVTEDTGH